MKEIEKNAQGQIRRNELLARHTTWGLGGPADLWFEPRDIADLQKALNVLRRHRIEWRVLGAGSNILFSDEGFRGVIIHLKSDFARIDVNTKDELVRISYCAGMSCRSAHLHATESELVGLEFLYGIPGTLGGAVRMNAGTDIGDMADVVEGIEIVSAEEISFIPSEKLGFGYRKANIPAGSVITRVALVLRQADQVTLNSLKERVRKEAVSRNRNQPKGRSAGSVFKNPQGDHAGRLLDACNLKGKKIGGAYVSEIHANFLMNDGNATSLEMLELINLCRMEVEGKFGVRLELEVEIVGVNNAV